MAKKVAVIALDPMASRFYGKQVQELFGEYVEVKSYSVLAGTVSQMERSDLYLMSTDAFDNREDVPQYIPIDAQISEIHVSYLWEVVKRLQAIPAGTKALFVNLTEKMVREATAGLNQLGVNHLQFIPFYPGADPAAAEGIDLAVTPDEERYVPAGMKQVMNIGQRCLTSGTMIEAALKLGLEELLETRPFQEYFSSIATNTYSFDLMFARTRRLESQFDILMEILDEGIIGINERAELFAMNEKAEEITGLKRSLVMHRQASTVLGNIPFLECLKTKRKLEAKVTRINGANVAVSVSPVLRKGECIGAFAILQRFNDSENRQNELRSQLLHKGYRAKYTFDDVVGDSEGIRRTKQILRKMASTESPVLLIGETGTGKELFANAVHLASSRAKGPFVAINCGAMPENLLESELFGAEEGAFTGAKKGGRPGLFEFAHHGTLFLDEVEGMSPALQVKLLRVLQEHEIMRVGGNRIIHIDVRIVAATNESLEEKVRDGSFRRDLYYRLNTLPVLIPPLRARGEDVFLLLERFGRKLGGSFVLSEKVKGIFREYSWPGNIRELRNLAEYFTFTGSPVITEEDLPPTFLYEREEVQEEPFVPPKAEPRRLFEWERAMEEKGILPEAYGFVLKMLYQWSKSREAGGRERLLERARKEGVGLSQLEVRTVLGVFKEYGLARVERGRGGSRITSAGQRCWEEMERYQPRTN